MKHALKALLIAGALGAGTLLAAPSASAQVRADVSVGVNIDLGHVSVGYRNGYYDHRRRWHRWRSDDECRYFRRQYRSRYHDYDYDWRDDDRRDRGRHRGHRRHRDWDD
jgi:hypothetical protein